MWADKYHEGGLYLRSHPGSTGILLQLVAHINYQGRVVGMQRTPNQNHWHESVFYSKSNYDRNENINLVEIDPKKDFSFELVEFKKNRFLTFLNINGNDFPTIIYEIKSGDSYEDVIDKFIEIVWWTRD